MRDPFKLYMGDWLWGEHGTGQDNRGVFGGESFARELCFAFGYVYYGDVLRWTRVWEFTHAVCKYGTIQSYDRDRGKSHIGFNQV